MLTGYWYKGVTSLAGHEGTVSSGFDGLCNGTSKGCVEGRMTVVNSLIGFI